MADIAYGQAKPVAGPISGTALRELLEHYLYNKGQMWTSATHSNEKQLFVEYHTRCALCGMGGYATTISQQGTLFQGMMS